MVTKNDLLPDNPDSYNWQYFTMSELLSAQAHVRSVDWLNAYATGNNVDKAEMSAYKTSLLAELKKRS